MERNWKWRLQNILTKRIITLQNVAKWIVSIHAASNLSSKRAWCAWNATGNVIYEITYWMLCNTLQNVAKRIVSIHTASNLSSTRAWCAWNSTGNSSCKILYFIEYITSHNGAKRVFWIHAASKLSSKRAWCARNGTGAWNCNHAHHARLECKLDALCIQKIRFERLCDVIYSIK